MEEHKVVSSHGGDVYSEGELKGRQLIDYSSNINPLGVPGLFMDNILDALKAVEKYPDFKYRRLREGITNYHFKCDNVDIKQEQILLGNGASEILNLAIASVSSILIVVPSFIEYEEMSKKWNVHIIYSYLNEDMEYDYEDIMKKLQQCEGLIIANPNNPTGNIVDKRKFNSILDYCESHNKKIIIDEAFVEFTSSDRSFIKLTNKYKCLFIVRAITKFFGMPGIRFGYGITSSNEIIKFIEEKQDPWNINAFAEYGAICSFLDDEYINKSRTWIKEEKTYFFQRINEISFVDRAYKTNANFILVKLKGITGSSLYDKCLEGGYLIRKANNFIGLNDSYVRFAIKDREKNNRFLSFLNNLSKEVG